MNFRVVDKLLTESAQKRWRVILKGKCIDVVFFAGDMDASDVKYSLINHDGYDSRIYVTEGADDPLVPEKNPFHKVLTKHGFACVSADRKHNQLLPANDTRGDYVEFVYTNPAHGKSHVLIWMYPDGKKTFIFRHQQSNGIMAPCHGDTKGQLDRALTREYGEPKE